MDGGHSKLGGGLTCVVVCYVVARNSCIRFLKTMDVFSAGSIFLFLKDDTLIYVIYELRMFVGSTLY